MHDTFLNERIYETLLKLCKENKVIRLDKVCIIVNTDSHISDESLYEHFKEHNSNLIGSWTKINIEKQNIGKLNAIINNIEGEQSFE